MKQIQSFMDDGGVQPFNDVIYIQKLRTNLIFLGTL